MESIRKPGAAISHVIQRQSHRWLNNRQRLVVDGQREKDQQKRTVSSDYLKPSGTCPSQIQRSLYNRSRGQHIAEVMPKNGWRSLDGMWRLRRLMKLINCSYFICLSATRLQTGWHRCQKLEK
jgi:hypothetical protein